MDPRKSPTQTSRRPCRINSYTTNSNRQNDQGADVVAGYDGTIACGKVSTVIDGGTFTYAGNGSQLRGGASIQSNSTLTINGGVFNHYVYAGGFSAGGDARVDGNTSLQINGGTFNAHVFGGCGANNSFNGKFTMVYGDSEVVVNATDATITFNGNIYAGSMGYGHVNGGTSLTFTGDGSKLLFSANSYVSGNSQMFKGSTLYVDGNQSLVFDNFTGNFSANINNTFTRLVASGSQVAFTGGRVALDSIATWEIEVGSADAELTLGDANNNFADDTLELTLAVNVAPTTDGWDVIKGTAIDGWDAFSAVTLCGESAAFTDGEWTTNAYRLFRDGDTLKLAALA